MGCTTTCCHLLLVICCGYVMMESTVALAFSDDTNSPEVDSSKLRALLHKLSVMKQRLDSSGTPSPLTASTPELPALSDPQPRRPAQLPNSRFPQQIVPTVKRNCQVGLSNDCGAAHTAYMSGMKSFLSNKRDLENSTVEDPGESESAVGTPLKNLDTEATNDVSLEYNRYLFDDTEDNLLERMLLLYLERLSEEREQRRRTDRLCQVLMGQPCDMSRL